MITIIFYLIAAITIAIILCLFDFSEKGTTKGVWLNVTFGLFYPILFIYLVYHLIKALWQKK